MENPGTLELIGLELERIVSPLSEHLAPDRLYDFLTELGILFPANLFDDPVFQNAFTSCSTATTTIIDAVTLLVDGISSEDTDKIADAIQDIIDGIPEFNNCIKSLETIFSNNLNPFAGITADDLADYLSNFFERIIDYLIIRYLEDFYRPLLGILEIAGVVIRTEKQVMNTGSDRRYVDRSIRYDRITRVLSDPAGLFTEVYGWGTSDLETNLFIEKLGRLLDGFNIPNTHQRNPDIPEGDRLILGAFHLVGRDDLTLPALQVIFIKTMAGHFGFDLPLSPSGWQFALDLNGDVTGAAGLTIEPPFTLSMDLIEAMANLGISFGLSREGTGGNKVVLLGQSGGSRLEVGEIGLSSGANIELDALSGEIKGGLFIEGEISDGAIVIQSSGSDGFLSTILPEDGFQIDFDILMGIDSSRGLYFEGSGGFEIQLPINLDLFVIQIETLTIKASISQEGFPLELGADIKTILGPFQASVNDMGLKAIFTIDDEHNGNLGPIDLDIGFKPPTGVGLALDAEVIKGGGFLDFDFEAGRYSGIVQLSIKEVVNVVAIGLITTKNPDGSEGFSLLLMITAEFTPIQLGFGFTLNGVGGLIGVNRTMVLQALRDGVRDNSLDNILFPSDPIANANQIISDLEEIFPVEQNRYAFGLMGKLGWGTPTLISLELGLILEVPNPVRLAILGVVKMVLPTEEAAILKLQVNFVGTIDFEAKYITFDASLFDSSLLIFTLSGDMALRIKWGDDANFLFTVGGFHPDYTPPPLDLPDLRRLSISLLADNPRLTISTYFAVTSNTVQFGAGVDFYFGVAGFRVIGYLNFDALFQFNPFYFKISLAAGLGVYLGSAEILSIHLSGSLEGPTPWHITGRVKFKILFIINVSVSIETTWGESKNTSLPDIEVLPLLKDALSNKANWITPIESTNDNPDSLVFLRTIDNTADDIIAHPIQNLSVSQKVVPLDVNIEKFGTQNPSDFTHFHLDMVDGDDNDITDVPVKEEFAPDSFFNMNESERLSRPSFEKYNSGLDGSDSSQLDSEYFREREVEFEQIIFDEPDLELPLYKMIAPEFDAFTRNGSIAKSHFGAKAKGITPLAPGKVSIAGEEFTIVDTNDLSVIEEFTAGSMQEAQERLNIVLAEQPELEDQLDIIHTFELA